jgi:hypothetical protein
VLGGMDFDPYNWKWDDHYMNHIDEVSKLAAVIEARKAIGVIIFLDNRFLATKLGNVPTMIVAWVQIRGGKLCLHI